MERKTQFLLWYFALAFIAVLLLRAREALLRTSAGELLARETLGEGEPERIRQAAAAPVLPLPQAA